MRLSHILFLATTVSGFYLPTIFQDGMVLQSGHSTIWGFTEGNPGAIFANTKCVMKDGVEIEVTFTPEKVKILLVIMDQNLLINFGIYSKTRNFLNSTLHLKKAPNVILHSPKMIKKYLHCGFLRMYCLEMSGSAQDNQI